MTIEISMKLKELDWNTCPNITIQNVSGLRAKHRIEAPIASNSAPITTFLMLECHKMRNSVKRNSNLTVKRSPFLSIRIGTMNTTGMKIADAKAWRIVWVIHTVYYPSFVRSKLNYIPPKDLSC